MRRSRIASLSSDALQVEGLATPIEVRRHPAARRMTLRVSRTRRAVVVTLPLSCGLEQAGTFVASHIDWLRAQLGELPAPVGLVSGATIPLRGRMHRVVCLETSAAASRVRIQDPQPPHGVPCIMVAGRIATAQRRLKEWLIGEARADLDARVMAHTRALGVRASRLAIRDQVSRWGSCSSTGALSFSWRLIMAPPDVLDYVAAHEVAHLREMNHGPRFWQIVYRLDPDADAARRWLATHGLDLHRYAPGI